MAAPGNSFFTAMFNNLRQHMREHHHQQARGHAGLFQVPPPPVTEAADHRTMQLFPTRAGVTQPSQDQERSSEAQVTAPLTISYEGRVHVFKDFPADKAKELMQMARSWSTSPPQEKEAPAMLEETAAADPSEEGDMPAKRKASLQRFLEKRKNRSSATEPYRRALENYIGGGGKPSEDELPATWLRLRKP